MEEGDSVTQTTCHENLLQTDCNGLSQFDPQDPGKALALVHSVLTRRQQAVQVRAPVLLLSHHTGPLDTPLVLPLAARQS